VPTAALVTLPVSMRSLDRALVMLEVASTADSPCSDSPSVSKDTCLTKSAKCLWMELEGKNLCMPCAWGGVNIPCAPVGSLFAHKKVRQCEMKCAHQQVITKVSSCVDVGGDISQDECFAKGQSALTKCMHTAYTTSLGQKKNICGACSVEGVGKIPPYSPGNLGPEPGSTVVMSASQCDLDQDEFGVPCSNALGIPAVTQCQPPPPPMGPTIGAVPLTDFGIKVDPGAPTYYASIVTPPFGPKEYNEASAAAARAAGWPIGSALLPSAPVVVYGPPPLGGPTLPPSMKALYGPGPPMVPGIPLPGFGVGTAPPPAASLLSIKQRASKRFRLHRKSVSLK